MGFLRARTLSSSSSRTRGQQLRGRRTLGPHDPPDSPAFPAPQLSSWASALVFGCPGLSRPRHHGGQESLDAAGLAGMRIYELMLTHTLVRRRADGRHRLHRVVEVDAEVGRIFSLVNLASLETATRSPARSTQPTSRLTLRPTSSATSHVGQLVLVLQLKLFNCFSQLQPLRVSEARQVHLLPLRPWAREGPPSLEGHNMFYLERRERVVGYEHTRSRVRCQVAKPTQKM